jgi:hypothetical protein
MVLQLPLLLIALAAATYFLYMQIIKNGRRRKRKGKIPCFSLDVEIIQARRLLA